MDEDDSKAKTLKWADYLVIVAYFLFVLAVGLWVNLLFLQDLSNDVCDVRRHGALRGAVSEATSWPPGA